MSETKRWRMPAQHLQNAKAALGGNGEHCRGIAIGPEAHPNWFSLSGVLSQLQMGKIIVPIPTNLGGGNTSLEAAYCAARTDDPVAQRRILQTASTRAAHRAAGRDSGTPLSTDISATTSVDTRRRTKLHPGPTTLVTTNVTAAAATRR